ncbi:MAG: RagB/SusD family nutrient uptake outer membrane protein [Bacteroidales bacterium]|nr:RagB/SusD family nutrient uptake outer membrane protein [Bacteroidales bacterium]
MKYRNIKSILSIVSIALAVSMTSCVNDLNVQPIDPSVTQTFDQDGVFAKIYASLALSGQEGPSGNGDVAGIDEGTSNFARLIWNLNELTTDEGICSWGDPGIPEMNFNKWSSSHDQLKGLYGRLYFGVTICNHFLEQTTGKTDEKTVKQRAEARFMRALNYYYLMDMFANVPFTEVVSETPAPQIKRADLFTYLEKELKAIEPDMYAPRQAPYYRVDKAAAWLLLSRMYLNAEVYTGTARWDDAAIYAKKVKDDSGYTLCPTFRHLFMADNAGTIDGSSVNLAPNEIIFPIAADGVKTKSWGASLFLIASTHTTGMQAWGTTAGWGGNRARQTLVKKFFPGSIFVNDKKDLTTSKLTSTKDARALFYGDVDRTLAISNAAFFKEGYSVIKFSNLRADGGTPNDVQYTDMDIPFMRVAEAYLIYAEAKLRSSAANAPEALTVVNQLRARAGAIALTSIDLDKILDENSREFFFEGKRRIDLVRFNKYGGATGYTWDWKNGVAAGSDFSAIYNIFPLPSTDLNANPNLTQNPGY